MSESIEVAIFVPAVLGAGVMFSLGLAARDLLRSLRGQRGPGRREIVEGRVAASLARPTTAEPMPVWLGFRPRWLYGPLGVAAVALAVYVTIGAWANFLGVTEWAEYVAWALAMMQVAAMAFSVTGVAALVLFVRWHHPPPWAWSVMLSTRLAGPRAGTKPAEGPETPVPTRAVLHVPRRRPLGPHHVTDRWAVAARWTARVWSLAAALLFVVVALGGRLAQAESGGTIDAAIAGPLQVALLVVTVAGVVLALRFEAVGATVMALGAAGLGVLSAVQYPPQVAVVIGVVFFVPAFLHWLAWQREHDVHHLFVTLVVTVLLLGGMWGGATQVYGEYFGPTHPSSVVAAEASELRWAWSGGTTATSTTVVAKARSAHERARVLLSERADLQDARASAPVALDGGEEGGVIRARFDDLSPGTTYHYAVELDGVVDTTRSGTLRTLPDGPAGFTVAFAACARTGSNGAVFDAIRAEAPLVYINDGDLHYANISQDDEELFREALDDVLEAPGQSALYRSTSAAYVWDDHDYSGNDANETAVPKPAAQAVYRQYVPHHELAGGVEEGPVYQAFTAGRVRFLLTDTRSTRTPQSAPDDADKYMLGPEQERWLVDELTRASRGEGIVVWVNPVPWIGAPAEGSDSWAGYATQRARIADRIAELGLADRMLMLSGDAHMVALDDGTNSDYSSTGGEGFPVLHAGALDRPGGVKGGPYSDGTYPGSGQYGLVEVSDDGGDTITVTLSGRTWDGRTLVERVMERRAVP
jgi:hypothetical protein